MSKSEIPDCQGVQNNCVNFHSFPLESVSHALTQSINPDEVPSNQVVEASGNEVTNNIEIEFLAATNLVIKQSVLVIACKQNILKEKGIHLSLESLINIFTTDVTYNCLML